MTRLAPHTGTPEDCHFGFWDGWGQDLEGPKMGVPSRGYFLFHGSILDPGEGVIPRAGPHTPQLWIPAPSLVWPADRAWCAAKDVDPHWAGVGGSGEAINELLADPSLDAIIVYPGTIQPYYRQLGAVTRRHWTGSGDRGLGNFVNLA